MEPAKLYISHGASGGWFIVEPRDNPREQVLSLLRAGRSVYGLNAVPFQATGKVAPAGDHPAPVS